MLKKILLASAATVLLSVPAMAADVVEAPVEVSSWTAFTIGAGIGAAWSDFSTGGKYCAWDGDEYFCYKDNDVYDWWYYDIENLFHDGDDTAFRGIVQLGFDWEVTPGFVLGAFGDLNFGQQTGVSHKEYYDYWYNEEFYDDVHDKFSYGVDNLWTLGGRLGYGTENALFYGLIGYTWADTEAKLKLDCYGGSCGFTAKNDDTIDGVTFGGGIEFKGWLWDSFSTAIEYRYTDLDDVKVRVYDEYGEDYIQGKVGQDVQKIELILKYRFGMGM